MVFSGVGRRFAQDVPATVWLALACVLWCRFAAAAAPQPQRTDLVTDIPGAGDLAAPANGQTLYVLDTTRGEVVAVDPFEPTKRWSAVAAGPAAVGAVTLSMACIDTSMIALLCRSQDAWSLQTHRLQPGTAAEPGKPVQTVSVAAAPRGPGPAPVAASNAVRQDADERACLIVSPSRDWLGVCGLPAPLPAVLRAPIAGARIGGLSSRACPALAPGQRLSAATISTAEEFVLFATDPAARTPASFFVSFYLPPDPRQLLHLDTSLPQVRDAAFCRTDGTLWVAGGEAGSDTSPEGLWRIDAILRNGRQAVQPVCVARLNGARSVVCLSDKAIIVIHGREARTVSRIDPTQPASTP
ncbi:MAG: hypothetical protein NTY17_07825 [Planctomycetia bacterium]|nr:hypothetical protein [Planctomycetia bacterium]